jgi:hypothetical protein
MMMYTGTDPEFQVRGAHLKKLRRTEGGANNFGVFRVKNHDFKPKIIFFPILGGGACRVNNLHPVIKVERLQIQVILKDLGANQPKSLNIV